MPDLPWLRLYTDTVDNEKIRLLAFEDRWHYIALLCLKQQGVLDSKKELLDRKVAIKLGLHKEALDEVKRRLIEVELIDENWSPNGWENKQFKSDSSNERVRKHRINKKKKECNVTSPLQKRKCSAIDTDTDTDTEKPNTTPSAKLNGQIPVKKIIDLYHEMLPTLPRIEKITSTREGYIKQRWREDMPDLKNWENFYDYVSQSDFLMGKTQPTNGRKVFIANLEWMTKPANFAKILEDHYHGV